jgi:hypothetical protein
VRPGLHTFLPSCWRQIVLWKRYRLVHLWSEFHAPYFFSWTPRISTGQNSGSYLSTEIHMSPRHFSNNWKMTLLNSSAFSQNSLA